MTATKPSLLPQRTVDEFIITIEKLIEEIQNLYCLDEIPWVIGYSGGKDSTVILQLIWNALSRLPIERRTKTVHAITTDTLVENPIVAAWVKESIRNMRKSAKEQQMPIEAHLLYPNFKDSFWVCLLGKGYPAPRPGFRWCTDRMKIQPVNSFIRDVIRTYGETIVVLGIRKAESSIRASVMEKYEEGRIRERLSPNSRLPNSLVYSPIEDWRTDEVWMYLMQWENPWGINNKDLFSMYRGATADNECPLVVDTSTPSCGSSRFGCWVCTMVNKDKSMEAMIQNDEEKEWLQPLLDLRNELDTKSDRDKRDFRRIYGKVELFERKVETDDKQPDRQKNPSTELQPIPGPYKKEWREYLLRRLLQAQVQIRQTAPPEMGEITLITPEELSEIRRIWLEEKHEFEDSLPQIYQEVTGEEFIDRRPEGDRTLLGLDEWSVLEEVTDKDSMEFELLARLLNTERQYQNKSSRSGIYEALSKCFEISSREREKAIQQAHFQRAIKTAVLKGDAEKVEEIIKNPEKADPNHPDNQPKPEPPPASEQLSLGWGEFKFGSSAQKD
ncbi:DNA phosphorothioation system sulfurtransferase DndC [Roseofilum sp. BLCC_M91]|uniref:DNA phosphorothioation system sulfurtransferase DndC n=1 Tax=Roseofilum halophilum BLCC-M91 TaxID=3022259 RepID=A0ABT7BK49_9CYAN|nr:DNA phosphorothioation system sulfurtransferase DndC [Roseofilum halophilum]MDJ1179544.1 DNA phosphorothioation system sulfurtransferase DndC [Roseofilum halophilum BLCC-M91]